MLTGNNVGFGPKTPGSPFGPGHISFDDSDVYLTTSFSRQIYITESTYNALINFIEHLPPEFADGTSTYIGLGPTNNCIDFAYALLSIADGRGFPPELRAAWPTWNDNFLMRDLLDRIDHKERVADFGHSDYPVIPSDPWGAIYNLGQCFSAGTRIRMADGSEKSIEDIEVGDLVLAFDPKNPTQTGGLSPKKVINTFRNYTDHWYLLQAEDSNNWQAQELLVTSGHRFLASDGLFRAIKDILSSDSIIFSENGNKIKVKYDLLTKNSIFELEKNNLKFVSNYYDKVE